jgi:hypothetical protein
MKLNDVIAAAGLSAYAEVALLIFFGVFLGVAIDLLHGAKRHEAMRLLPLDDERPRRARGESP